MVFFNMMKHSLASLFYIVKKSCCTGFWLQVFSENGPLRFTVFRLQVFSKKTVQFKRLGGRWSAERSIVFHWT